MGHLTCGVSSALVLICLVFPSPKVAAVGWGGLDSPIGDPSDGWEDFLNGMDLPDLSELFPPEDQFGLDDGWDELFTNLSSEVLDEVCETLLGMDPDTAEQMMGVINCGATFSRLASTNDQLSKDMEKAAVAAMRKDKPATSWSSSEWRTAFSLPDGLLPEDIRGIPTDILFQNMDKLTQHAADLEAELADSVIDQMIKAAGDLTTLNSTFLAAMSSIGLLPFMDAEDLKKIPKAVKKNAMNYIKYTKLPDDIAAEIYDEVMGNFSMPSEWSSEDFTSIADLIKYDAQLIGKIPEEQFLPAINELGRKALDEVEARGFVDRLLAVPKYSNATSWDMSMMASTRNLMGSLFPPFMDQLDDTAIFEAINYARIGTVPFSKSSGRSIFEKVRSKLGGVSHLNAAMLAKLGTTLKSVRFSDVGGLDPNAAAQAIETFSMAYNDMEESTRAALLDKFGTQTMVPGGLTGYMAFQLGPFFKQLSMDNIDALPFYFFNATYLHYMEPLQVTMTQAQASRVMWQIEKRFGSPANFTMTMWSTLGGAICGLSCDVIRTLPHNSHFWGLLSHIAARREPCLGDAQTRCMAQRVRTYLWGQETSGHPNITRTTKATIDKVGAFLPYLSDGDLRALPTSVCTTVVKSLGKRSLDSVPRSTLINLKKYAFKCANKETSGKVTLTDVKYVGDVICGLEKDDVTRLEDKFFTNRILQVGEKCRLPLKIEKAMAARARTALKIVSMSNITTGQLVNMGPALVHLSDEDLSKINKTTLSQAAVRILNSFKRRSNMAKRRQDLGMTTDVTDVENEARRQAKKRLFGIITTQFEKQRLLTLQPAPTPEALVDAGTTADADSLPDKPDDKEGAGPGDEGGGGPGDNGLDGSGPSRKRRATATSAMTCSDVVRLGDAVVTFNTEQLNLADNAFLNCAETLGRQTGFSDAQKQTLAIVATRATTWGTPGLWTATEIISAGVIAQGLSPAQLELLHLSTIDKLSSIFGKWLKMTQRNDPSEIDSTELKSIGEFACGATTSQISTIPSESYQSAAAMVGQLGSCDQGQMSAYARHATAVFGVVESWDSSTVGTVGTMIGGLSISQLSSMTLPHIQALQPKTISMMPPGAFAGFTASQLSQLSPAQAQSVTASQQAALSDDKMEALQSAGAVVRSGDSGNSATTLECSEPVAIVLVLALLTKAFITC